MTPLVDVVDFIIKNCKQIAKDSGYGAGKDSLGVFIDKTDGYDANEDIFEICRDDTGTSIQGSSKRKLKLVLGPYNRKKTLNSKGVYLDVQNLLLDHIDNWEECENCKKLSDVRDYACMNCSFGDCPICNNFIKLEADKCSHCDEEINFKECEKCYKLTNLEADKCVNCKKKI